MACAKADSCDFFECRFHCWHGGWQRLLCAQQAFGGVLVPVNAGCLQV
jgi:hypothetical protein